MATAIAKDAKGRAVTARVRADVIDKWDDGIVVRVKITPELIGNMVRGRVEELIISSVGPNTRELRVIE
jgi:hypothetical protein